MLKKLKSTTWSLRQLPREIADYLVGCFKARGYGYLREVGWFRSMRSGLPETRHGKPLEPAHKSNRPFIS